MRKMRNVVVAGKSVFVGLEDAKRTWKLSVRSEGMEVHFTTMPARYENLCNYLRNRYPHCKVKVIYEAGFKGFGLHDRLEADGFDCEVAAPSRITHERRRKVKNDKIDGRRLALILEKDDYPPCAVPDQERREDRQISRTLQQYTRDLVRAKARVRSFADQHGIGEDMPVREWKDSEYELLREAPVSSSLRITLNSLLDELEHIRSNVKLMREHLRELTGKQRYRQAFELLQTAPGIGWQTAIRLVLEWGEEWSRFASVKKFSRFTGFTPCEDSTGEREHKGEITGESTSYLRALLVECAWTAIRKDPVLLHKYQAVYKSHGRNHKYAKKKAIVATARKLLVRLRAVLNAGQPYCVGVLE
jgi:transposase